MPKKSQKEKFIDKARELEADANESAFERTLKRLAKANPESRMGGKGN
jgi:hypothetical protein